MKSITRNQKYVRMFIWVLLSMATISNADMLVYEPFDYQTHNDEVMGRLEGRNGGLGFSEPWVGTSDGFAFVYDKRGNPEDLYDGRWGEGVPSWDGVVDNLPTMGGFIGFSDWDRLGSVDSSRKLAQSAGYMAKGNSGVLWLISVWHLADQSYLAPIGIGLSSSGRGFANRAINVAGNADVIGVGNGHGVRKRKGKLTPVIWIEGKEVAASDGPKVDSAKDAVVILKFEFGEVDKVSAWRFPEDQEMTEEVFNSNAVSCSYAVDEDSLEYLIIASSRRHNAVDEIRMGTTFKSVISGAIPPRQEVKITKKTYDSKTDSYSLEIASNPGETYGIYLSEDAGGYKPCIAEVVNASKDRNVTTYGPFPSPRKGNASLDFEVGLPDSTPPAFERVWGSGKKINLLFSERMLPETSLDPGSYTVEAKDGTSLGVKSVHMDPETGSVELMLAEAMKPAQAYSITTVGLSDLANNPLTDGAVELKTWDEDNKGIKVFILAGQSNMVGYGHSEDGNGGRGGPGSLRHLAVNDAKYPEYNYAALLADPTQPTNSAWKTRSDVKVWWRNGVKGSLGGPIGKGDLGPPFHGANGNWFGPEFGFGQVIGDYYADDDVLIIKAAWGGHKLVSDFRPPSAVAKRGDNIGPSYIEMFNNIREVLFNLGTVFPEWEGRGYQIVGFAWHQGTSDKSPQIVADEYKYNLPDFISDVRREFGKPDLPFVIATTGMSGPNPVEPYPYENYHPVERAQLWVSGVDKPHNVLTDDTRGYWEDVEVSPRNQGFHWNQNARSYFRVGLGLGTNMVTILEKQSVSD